MKNVNDSLTAWNQEMLAHLKTAFIQIELRFHEIPLEDYPGLALRPVFFSVRGAVKWNYASDIPHIQKKFREGVFPSCWLQQCPEHHDKNGQLQTARTHRGSLPAHQVQPHKVQLVSVI